MADIFTAAGTQLTYWGFLKSGYCYGTDYDLANGEDIGMGRLLGVQSFGLQKPASRNIVSTGDNGVLGSIKIPGGEAPAGSVVTSVKDPVFATAAQALLIASLGGRDLYLDGVPCPTYRPMVIVHNTPATNQSSGSVGEPGWEITLWLAVQVEPTDNDVSEASPHQFTHNITGTLSDRLPWGASLVAATHGATKALKVGPFFSDYPLTIHTFISNNSATTFTLDETPAGADANSVPAFSDGAIMTYDAAADAATEYNVTVATKTFTIGAAPAAGVKILVPYFFVPVC